MHVADLVSFRMDHVFCPSFEVFYLDIAKCSQLLNTKKRKIFDIAITYGCFHINLVYGKILMKIGERGHFSLPRFEMFKVMSTQGLVF